MVVQVVLGSVALGVASTSSVPVVVIRPGTEATNTGGPVVVGIDGPPTLITHGRCPVVVVKPAALA
jgi:hypothetical protein